MIHEMLCAPAAGGQAVVEMHLTQRFLAGDPVPYSRKRRVRHTFVVRARDQDITFEVSAWVSAVKRAGNRAFEAQNRRLSLKLA